MVVCRDKEDDTEEKAVQLVVVCLANEEDTEERKEVARSVRCSRMTKSPIRIASTDTKIGNKAVHYRGCLRCCCGPHPLAVYRDVRFGRKSHSEEQVICKE